MTIDLKSVAVAMPDVAGHPNRAAFQGVLTMVDVPSQRPPSGAKGHLVVLTRKAAEAALPSLLGMGVDYSPSLDRHDVRCKVGVITRAEIVGRNVEVGGYLFARDFPEILREIAKGGRTRRPTVPRPQIINHMAADAPHLSRLEAPQREDGPPLRSSLRMAAAQLVNLTETLRVRKRFEQAQRITSTIQAGAVTGSAGLGMSYEVTAVQLSDKRAKIWTLEKVTFTGAAILRRDKAAYSDTWIELSS
jgi:hypothetical protein